MGFCGGGPAVPCRNQCCRDDSGEIVHAFTSNRTLMREASGRRTTWVYDLSYQLVNEHRSSTVGEFNTTHVYDPVGNRLVKNESGSLTTATYDAANQLVTSVDSGGTTTFTFDAAGNQQLEQAPGGITT